jgi:hypothetical protein
VAEGFTGEDSMVADSTAAIATLSEVTAVATAITGTEAIGMVALTTAADIMEARIGGVTHSVTMTMITNRIRPTDADDGTTDAVTAPALSTITAVQQKLAQLGYYHARGDLATSGNLFLDGWLLGAQDIQKCFKGWAVRSTRPGGTKTHGIGLHRQWSAYRVLLLQAARATGH